MEPSMSPLPVPPRPEPGDPAGSAARWAASGLQHLTGPVAGPTLGPPAPLVPAVLALTRWLARTTGALGRAQRLDGLALLAERAAVAGLHRRGATSCGGATRLLTARDGWLALSLARPDDVALAAAWLAPWGAVDAAEPDPWGPIAAIVRGAPAADLRDLGADLGLPLSILGERRPGLPIVTDRPAERLRSVEAFGARVSPVPGPAAPPRPLAEVRVVDLSALWAGPLCGSLLAAAGARVVKVESVTRPDGARSGPPRFYDLLNGGKQSVALDLATARGRAALGRLVAAADVVIEASRPRALEQLGISATAVQADGGPRVWISITGHGRRPGERDRVGFGDDAAVAGGLVAWAGGAPVFCADAIADPLAGLVATAWAAALLVAGGRWSVDVPLAGVAAAVAGPTLPAHPAAVPRPPRPPRADRPCRPAPALGADNAAVLGSLHRAT